MLNGPDAGQHILQILIFKMAIIVPFLIREVIFKEKAYPIPPAESFKDFCVAGILKYQDPIFSANNFS